MPSSARAPIQQGIIGERSTVTSNRAGLDGTLTLGRFGSCPRRGRNRSDAAARPVSSRYDAPARLFGLYGSAGPVPGSSGGRRLRGRQSNSTGRVCELAGNAGELRVHRQAVDMEHRGQSRFALRHTLTILRPARHPSSRRCFAEIVLCDAAVGLFHGEAIRPSDGLRRTIWSCGDCLVTAGRTINSNGLSLWAARWVGASVFESSSSARPRLHQAAPPHC
jgi:hypothetical protein